MQWMKLDYYFMTCQHAILHIYAINFSCTATTFIALLHVWHSTDVIFERIWCFGAKTQVYPMNESHRWIMQAEVYL